MPVSIALLRGVNLGPHNRIKMDALRTLCESLGLRGVRTYVNSGNLVFDSKESNHIKLATRLERAIESEFGFRIPVILRTVAEWERAVERNPFAGRSGIEPSKLLVHFLASDPGETGRAKARAIPAAPEEVHFFERELYIYYPNGMARPKLSLAAVERGLGVAGSGRNWNTVLKLRELAAVPVRDKIRA